MPLKLKCRCGEQLTAPESAIGKRGKCAKCGMTFVIPGPKQAVPAASPPADEAFGDLGLDLPDLPSGQPDLGSDFGDLLDEALSEPLPAASRPADASTAEGTVASSKRRGSSRAQMGVLANGIKLVFWGTLMGVIAIGLGFLAIFLSAPATLGVVLGGVVSTIGHIICLGAPSQVKGRALLVGVVVCDLFFIEVTLLGFYEPSTNQVFSSNFLWAATILLFVLFLKAVANSIDQEHLVKNAQVIIVFVVVAMILLVGIVIPALGFFLYWPFLVVMLVTMLKYLNLLKHTAVAALAVESISPAKDYQRLLSSEDKSATASSGPENGVAKNVYRTQGLEQAVTDQSTTDDHSSGGKLIRSRKRSEKMLIAFGIGALAGIAIQLQQFLFNDPAMTGRFGWNFFLLPLILGCVALVVPMLAEEFRKRNCPLCGSSMGHSQNSHAFASPKRATTNGKRLPEIISGYNRRGRPTVRTYYLCEKCDAEFLPEELPPD